MASLTVIATLALLILATTICAREITRAENDIASVEYIDGELRDSTETEEATTGSTESEKDRDERPEERKIKKQLKELKKLKCKPRREKVYTRENIDGSSEYLDRDLYPIIFPEVLSVQKCDEKCTYCLNDSKSRGYGHLDNKVCTSTKQTKKKFTIKVVDSKATVKYIKIKIPSDRKCECKEVIG